MSEQDLAAFRSIQWVQELLRDESFIIAEPRFRDQITEDKLFKTTLISPTRLAAFLPQYRKCQNLAGPSDVPPPVEELRLFWLLGSDLDGNPGMLHGGIVTTLLDQSMGFIVMFRGQYSGNALKEPGRTPTVTAYLNTQFRRPVFTPAAIMVHVRLVEVLEDRKWRVEATIYDHENRPLASGEALFVKTRARI
ncbi:hypothetical protein N7468_005476 [Penicillium chermesinum]|uniref:Thioesterase domain-containing protein n=1 Tax=Penicillium chermesinum TaxID=63820 RepID=A0A9W9NZG6_9EURO|nr:uncharacterized protein N7468_005476 [Penicillium chermesinum]KAJ5232520.1 hypothetical protein N7468_005476 [Penicillium chermesinum]KAJ6172174.1 hypothetical protein N7470_001241 [Penicillium chermesinum]